MNALLIFISTYFVVLALGLQSLFVNQNHPVAAFFNSFLIGAGQLGALQIVHASSAIEYAAYLSGGPFGIISSMFIYKRYLKRK